MLYNEHNGYLSYNSHIGQAERIIMTISSAWLLVIIFIHLYICIYIYICIYKYIYNVNTTIFFHGTPR